MEARQSPALAIEHVEGSSPSAFRLTRLEDGKSLPPVPIVSPYEFPVEGSPNSPLMRELRWYLEQFLDYPFYPETDHADRVLDALRAWGTQAFKALFDRPDAETWLADSTILQVGADDALILSWPWEALYDPEPGGYLAHQRRMERRLNRISDPQPSANLPNERVNILLVVCRPYENDVRYRSIARPLIELIQSRSLPAHVDVLRPPTFDQLREHLRQRPGYYHVLHFDGHGAYGPSGYSSPQEFRARQGFLIFEDKRGRDDPRSAKNIAALLHEYPVPAVVLNACQSATLCEKADNAFAAVATALLQSGMRSVVAMAYSLYASGAQVFLPAFYRRLFESGSVAEGVRVGRQQMLADKKRMSARGSYSLEDWMLPVLYQQAPLDFDFARQARIEIRESHLPQELRDHREAYGFIGRDGPILELERAIRRDQPCILVHGLGGVGKTTLARGFLRWLDETGGLDCALWFDFRDIRTSEYVLNWTGETFYGEDFRVASNQLDLLADALGQLRVLMVWDNFESAAENLPMQDRDELGRFLDAIRGTHGKVIMTSRSEEKWLGTRRCELPLWGLEGEERWEYCEIILRKLRLKKHLKDPALKELIDQLAGHPLAMRVVLPKLKHMPAAKVSEALRSNVAELGLSVQEEQGRLLATLRFVEQGLPEQLQPMLGLLAMHEAYLDTDFLKAMAKQVNPGWTRQGIDQLLAALANAGLIKSLNARIYEIHPLLTSYLRSRGAATEACQRAFVDAMGSGASQLAQLEFHEQRVSFLLYGANLNSALHLSQGLALHENFRALAQSLAIYALNSRKFVEASRLFSELAEHAAARANWEEEAVAYHQLGRVAQEQRRFAAAHEWYFKALAISEAQEDLHGAATTYHELGLIAEERHDFATAREWYLKSLTVWEKLGDVKSAAHTYHVLGSIALEQSDAATAQDWYLKSLSISESDGNVHLAAMTYHQLGRTAQEQRDYGRARQWYLKSLAIEEKHDNLQGARTYGQLGILAAAQQDFATARQWYLKSLTIDEKQGNLHGAAMTYGQLGILAARQGDFEQSGKWLARAITGFQQSHSQHEVQRNIENFVASYGQASQGEKEKLRAIWLAAGLGTFPEMT